jgi:ribosomal protein S27AE
MKEVWNFNSLCPKCKVPMSLGFALWPWYSRFVRYFAPQPNADRLKEVYKCPKCGHSEEIK